MQLLKITTTPIEYKLQLQNAALKVSENTPAKLNPKTNPSELNIKTQNIKVKLDTSRARDSLGFHDQTTTAKNAGERGLQAAQQATAQYAAIGNQLAQIQYPSQDVPTVFAQLLTKQPETAMVFLPSQGPDISWEPNSIDINYKPATVQTEWQSAKFTMEYVPSKYKLDIVQYPKVNIEYVGGPMYVPPSANPNYEK